MNRLGRILTLGLAKKRAWQLPLIGGLLVVCAVAAGCTSHTCVVRLKLRKDYCRPEDIPYKTKQERRTYRKAHKEGWLNVARPSKRVYYLNRHGEPTGRPATGRLTRTKSLDLVLGPEQKRGPYADGWRRGDSEAWKFFQLLDECARLEILVREKEICH